MNLNRIFAFIFFLPSLFLNHITLLLYDHDHNLSIFSIVVISIFNIINCVFCISILYRGLKKSIFFLLYVISILVLSDIAFDKFINTNKTIKDDELLGWILKSNVSFESYEETATKKKYLVNYKTSKVDGFREYGNTKINRENKMLVIGDSFANAAFASNENMFYNVMNKEFKENDLFYELFVGGAGGYGTLQEYILLQKHLKTIDPSIIIFQFCSNDFENNSYDLESKTITRSQKFRRPYLVNDEIKKDNSIQAKIYRELSKASYVFNVIDLMISNIQYRKYKGYFLIEPTKLEYEDSAKTTKDIISKIYHLAGKNTKIYSINCSIEDKKKTEDWLKIMNDLGIIALLSPSYKLEIAEKEGQDIWQRDKGHLNNLGNEIYGKAIADEIIVYLKKL